MGMVFHMKTTLNIDDTVMSRLKQESARQRRTMSELVEAALRLLFQSKSPRAKLAALPRMRAGARWWISRIGMPSTRPWRAADVRR